MYKEKWLYYEEEGLPDPQIKISNLGNVEAYRLDAKRKIPKKIGIVNRFLTVSVIKVNKKPSVRYIHRMVAMLFVYKRPGCDYVIHLNFDKNNNKASNLKWVNLEEKTLHHRKIQQSVKHSKLTETQVIRIKRMLHNPKRKTRMKIIAKQYGISEMQLWRIKSGENWGYVKY